VHEGNRARVSSSLSILFLRFDATLSVVSPAQRPQVLSGLLRSGGLWLGCSSDLS
jgi:hypothetical protein